LSDVAFALGTRAILEADLELFFAGPSLGRFPKSNSEIAEASINAPDDLKRLNGLDLKAVNTEPPQR
jgi:hypothetical protein